MRRREFIWFFDRCGSLAVRCVCTARRAHTADRCAHAAMLPKTRRYTLETLLFWKDCGTLGWEVGRNVADRISLGGQRALPVKSASKPLNSSRSRQTLSLAGGSRGLAAVAAGQRAAYPSSSRSSPIPSALASSTSLAQTRRQRDRFHDFRSRSSVQSGWSSSSSSCPTIEHVAVLRDPANPSRSCGCGPRFRPRRRRLGVEVARLIDVRSAAEIERGVRCDCARIARRRRDRHRQMRSSVVHRDLITALAARHTAAHDVLRTRIMPAPAG